MVGADVVSVRVACQSAHCNRRLGQKAQKDVLGHVLDKPRTSPIVFELYEGGAPVLDQGLLDQLTVSEKRAVIEAAEALIVSRAVQGCPALALQASLLRQASEAQ